MADEKEKPETEEKPALPADPALALTANREGLDSESLDLLNQIIVESDVNKAKDLTYLFNLNQNKKTLIRVNKMNELLDVITDATIARFTQRPDEISNQELLQGLKVVQDLVERGQKQASGVPEAPFIQVNQQHNEINLGDDAGSLSRESRDKVKNAVAAVLAGLADLQTTEPIDADYSDDEEDK